MTDNNTENNDSDLVKELKRLESLLTFEGQRRDLRLRNPADIGAVFLHCAKLSRNLVEMAQAAEQARMPTIVVTVETPATNASQKPQNALK